MCSAATKSPTEPLDRERAAAAIAPGAAPPTASYPYIVPPYELPFLHIGAERQLFLDNFILDHLDGVERQLPAPAKRTLLEFTDLPWERSQWNPGVSGVALDPDDGLFKMWYCKPADASDRPFVLCNGACLQKVL